VREGRRGRKHDASRARSELAGARRVVQAIPTMAREREQRGGGGARGEGEWRGVASEEEEVKRWKSYERASGWGASDRASEWVGASDRVGRP
jgi:hypothetical protein